MFSFDIHSHNFNHIHFIGIGGISMSGLAEISLNNGYKVSGSDVNRSPIIDKLEKKGATIFIGHESTNIEGADLVVYTSAISENNPEFKAANDHNILTVDRATFLGQLMKGYKNSIAVSGTHGKTTTTGMIASILNDSILDATILLGGELDVIGGNVKIGGDEFLLTEACEYKRNFLKFFPTIGIVLNIDEDHLDFFENIEQISETFSDFAKLIPQAGYLVINNDDEYTTKIQESANCNIITFGINNDSEYTANDIAYNEEGFPNFYLRIADNNFYKVNLSVIGDHNVYNALAAIAATHKCGIPIESIIHSLEGFTGTHRRFENKGIINGIKIIDDYAHHPTEIKATLSSAGKLPSNRIWCVFQPHTYTRTKALLDEFSQSFYDADKVIVTDIYAARELDTGLVHSRDLLNNLEQNGVDAIYISEFEGIVTLLDKNAQDGDIIITMGAGDVYKVGEMFLNKIEN